MVSQKSALVQAAQRGDALYFEPWEQNSGVIEMRRILVETRPNTGGRMQRAQQAFPPIKALWEQMNSGLQGMAIPGQIKKAMNSLFERIRTDKQYAIFVYNNFPQIADRYGAGKQANGKPRLSFVRMSDDPLCRALIK
ncbi:TPA: hypothetical protein ACSTJZ_003164 [Serratia fonticola]|uniref:hypothetical protein n=1 Tax=Serratia fonticola TaxID=47917 RepID=UPI0034C67436